MSINTPHATCSYAQNLWKASRAKNFSGQETGEPKYSCELIFDPSAVDMTPVNEAIQKALQEGIDKFKWNSKALPPAFRWPVVEGDKAKASDPSYAGKLIMRAGRKEEFGPPARVYNDGNYTPIANQADLYSGCVVVANVNFAPYHANDTVVGIACYLNGVMKMGEGDHLDNSQTPEQMFAGVSGAPTTSADQAPAGMQTGTGNDAPAPESMPDWMQ